MAVPCYFSILIQISLCQKLVNTLCKFTHSQGSGGKKKFHVKKWELELFPIYFNVLFSQSGWTGRWHLGQLLLYQFFPPTNSLCLSTHQDIWLSIQTGGIGTTWGRSEPDVTSSIPTVTINIDQQLETLCLVMLSHLEGWLTNSQNAAWLLRVVFYKWGFGN